MNSVFKSHNCTVDAYNHFVNMSVVLKQKVCIYIIMLFIFLSLTSQRKEKTVIMPLLPNTIGLNLSLWDTL